MPCFAGFCSQWDAHVRTEAPCGTTFSNVRDTFVGPRGLGPRGIKDPNMKANSDKEHLEFYLGKQRLGGSLQIINISIEGRGGL